MITLIGDGGHAKVCRDLIALRPNQNALGGFLVAVGDNAARKLEVETQHIFRCNPLIHPSAIVSQASSVGDGTVILEGAIVQAGAVIGEHVIINAGAVVTHDCVIEDFAHIAPGAHLCGGVHVGEGALVGVGVGIEQGATIPAWSIVKRAPYTVQPRITSIRPSCEPS